MDCWNTSGEILSGAEIHVVVMCAVFHILVELGEIVCLFVVVVSLMVIVLD